MDENKLIYELAQRVAALEMQVSMLIKMTWLMFSTITISLTTRLIGFITKKKNGGG